METSVAGKSTPTKNKHTNAQCGLRSFSLSILFVPCDRFKFNSAARNVDNGLIHTEILHTLHSPSCIRLYTFESVSNAYARNRFFIFRQAIRSIIAKQFSSPFRHFHLFIVASVTKCALKMSHRFFYFHFDVSANCLLKFIGAKPMWFHSHRPSVWHVIDDYSYEYVRT